MQGLGVLCISLFVLFFVAITNSTNSSSPVSPVPQVTGPFETQITQPTGVVLSVSPPSIVVDYTVSNPQLLIDASFAILDWNGNPPFGGVCFQNLQGATRPPTVNALLLG